MFIMHYRRLGYSKVALRGYILCLKTNKQKSTDFGFVPQMGFNITAS